MDKEEFINKIEERAFEFARKCIINPEKYSYEVELITEKYIEGAYEAYKLLTGENID